jgi:hypothetical protein
VSTFVHVILFVGGLALVIAVLDAAIRTFVLPRGAGVLFARAIALAVRAVFDLLTKPIKSYEGRDRVMAMYGPTTLLAFVVAWVFCVFVGFAMMYVAVTDLSWREAFRVSGSALFTLGFAVPATGPAVVLDFIEAGIGLLLIALLIAYLPTIYSSFSRREVVVTRMSVRAGTPPTPTNLLTRAHLTGFLDRLDTAWVDWELWFVELEETHTSLSILTFFRSPNPHRSWLTTAGAILDSAAIRLSTLNIVYDPAAATCLRSGYMALRAIADFFQVPYDPDPDPDDPITITRDEFMEVYEALAANGVPVRPDRERCWQAYRGWRVNYDAVLITLAGLIMAPYAPWVSDRSLREGRHRAPLMGPRSHRIRDDTQIR